MKLFRIIVPVIFALMLAIGSLLVLKPAPTHAAGPYFWVGGTGNWSDATNHWATISGGAPNVANVPGVGDNVTFDASSDSAGAFTVTITAPANCKDADFSGVDQIVTFAGSQAFNIYGSLTKKSTMLWTYSGTLTFKATTAKTITNNSVGYAGSIIFDGVAGSWQLQDALASTSSITVTNGTLDTNGVAVTLGTANTGTMLVVSTGTTLTLGASTITCDSGDSVTVSSGAALNAGTSALTCGALSDGGSKTFYDVTMLTPSAMSGANTFHNLTITAPDTADTTITFNGNQTITGTFTATGYSQSHRLGIFSNTLHTQRTITAATVSATNVLFRDIVGAGAGNWNLSSSTTIGNCGGNSGITFPVGINVYATAIPGAANWSSIANWASASNSIPGSGRVPLPQDLAVFDAYSIAVPGITITMDVHNISGIDSRNITNSPTFTSSSALSVYNSLMVGTQTFTVTNGFNLYGPAAQSLAGNVGNNAVVMDPQTGSFTLVDAFTTNYLFTVTSGILNTGIYSFNVGALNSATTTYNRGIVLGSGIVTLTYNATPGATVWNVNATNLNFNSGTSTMVITSAAATGLTFTPGTSLTYYDLQVRGSGSYALTFTAATTFHDVTIIRSNDSQTSAAAKTITGNFQLTITHLYSPLYGTTVTSIGTTDWSKSAGLVALDYLAFTGGANTAVASGGATPFLAGSHSTGSPQTGWSFTDATAPTISAQPATLTTRTTAVLNGSLDSLGSYTTEGAYIYFQYDLTGAYTSPTSTTPTLYTSVGIKSAGITGLDFNTTYHFRVVCSYNGGELLYGDDTTFLTLGAPVALTQDPTGKTGTGATLQGLLVDLGDYSDVFASFQYGATTSYGSITAPETHLSVLSPFSSTIGGLTAGATYHYRAVLRYNATQYAYGADISFVSNSTQSAPVMSTLNPSGITNTSAVLQGMLVSMGDYPFVLVSFQWGLTTGYGTETTAESFTTPSTYHTGITGLAVGKTYHYRAKGQYNNNTQTVYGSDVSFVAQVTVPVGGSNNSGLMPDHPSDPGLYNEGGTTFLGYALLLALANGWGIPLDLLIMFWCFGWALVLGLVAYRLTMGATNKYQKAGALALRPGSLFVQALVSLVVMIYFTFAGGGVIPSWVLIPFAVEAITAIIVRQNGGQVLGG